MNRNENEAESFAGNFVATGEWGLFFEVPIKLFLRPLRDAHDALHIALSGPDLKK